VISKIPVTERFIEEESPLSTRPMMPSWAIFLELIEKHGGERVLLPNINLFSTRNITVGVASFIPLDKTLPRRFRRTLCVNFSSSIDEHTFTCNINENLSFMEKRKGEAVLTRLSLG
jgi:hypothetical protein